MRAGLLLGFGPGAALGAGRFAYALVLPAMQAALQLSFAQAGLLGSANTAGYLLGALVSHKVLAAGGYRRVFYTSLILQAVTLLLLAFGPALPVIIVLRAIQGVLGAFVFVGGAALLLASGSNATGLGVYFGGVGLGIILSTLILPFLSSWQWGWLLLGALSLLMTGVALLAAPALREPQPPASGRSGSLGPIALALLAYGLYGAGYIGYMTFVTTGLTVSLAGFWAVLGVGAVLTGFVWGPLIERIGGAAALRVVLLVLLASSLQPLLLHLPFASAFLFGVSFLGVITAITHLFRKLLPEGAWPRAMGLSTAVFALGQAVGPSISGLAGDVFGGATGALAAASGLLAAALLVALLPLNPGRHSPG
jgi:MFS family permease